MTSSHVAHPSSGDVRALAASRRGGPRVRARERDSGVLARSPSPEWRSDD